MVFEGHEGIIVIRRTTVPDVLDPALYAWSVMTVK